MVRTLEIDCIYITHSYTVQLLMQYEIKIKTVRKF